VTPGEEDAKPSARSELVQGGFWIIVGGTIFYASWTMDRLESLGVKAFSAPGLLPGVLGVFIVVLGLVMLVRALRAGGLAHASMRAAIEWKRVLVPMLLCLGFGAGLVGRGLPFWAAAWIYVAVMVWALQYKERKMRGELGRLAAISISVGAGASAAVSLVFQELFLIRLP
jgi:hypothetical protein